MAAIVQYKLMYNFWPATANSDSEFIRELGQAKRAQLLKFSTHSIGRVTGLPKYYVQKFHLDLPDSNQVPQADKELNSLEGIEDDPKKFRSIRYTEAPELLNQKFSHPMAPHPIVDTTLWPYYDGGNIGDFKQKYVLSGTEIPFIVVADFVLQAISTLRHFCSTEDGLLHRHLDHPHSFLIQFNRATNRIDFIMANFGRSALYSEILNDYAQVNIMPPQYEDLVREDISGVAAQARLLLYQLIGPAVNPNAPPNFIINADPMLQILFAELDEIALAPLDPADEDMDRDLQAVCKIARRVRKTFGLGLPPFDLERHYGQHISDLRAGGGNGARYNTIAAAALARPARNNAASWRVVQA